jgi:hypothetical protein
LDEKIDPEESIPAFGFGLEWLPKQEVPGIEEENFLSFFFHLGDQGRFLGDTAKRTPKSPTGLDFTHHIIGVDDTELGFGCSLNGRNKR